MRRTITIVGTQNRLGCVLAAYLGSLGYDVKLPHSLLFPFEQEPLLEVLYRKAEPNIQLNDPTFQTDMVLMAKDTPIIQGTGYVEGIKQDCQSIITKMKDDSILLVSSQVPPGFCESLLNGRVRIGCWPENIRRGRAIESLQKVTAYIIGAEDEATGKRIESFLGEVPTRKILTDLKTAEASKVFLNSFLATCISWSKEMESIAKILGVDPETIHEYVTSDYRVGSALPLKPGKPYEGPLERDIALLISSKAESLFKAVKGVNESQ